MFLTRFRTYDGCPALAVFGLFLFGTLLVAVSASGQAAEYDLKPESSEESKIQLENSQRWFPSGSGAFSSGWADSYSSHLSDALWEGEDAILEIKALSLSGLYRWGENQTRIRERDLNAAYGEDLTDFAEVDCRPNGTCVRFTISPLDCFMVRYLTSPPGSKTQSDKGSSLVNVTYCAQNLRMPLDMDTLLAAISIGK